MVDNAPQAKHVEQYPLLKVDSGGGDGTVNQTPSAAIASGWSITCSLKRSWLDKWPEFISALWMTGILLGISFLVVYALSMGVIRGQPAIILKCNDSLRPASQVYYHRIVQHDTFVPFLQYSKYLADMAVQYPFLHFNVFFLLDDTSQGAVCRRSKFFSKLMSYYRNTDYITYSFDKTNRIGLRDFQKRYQNVDIIVLPLSKYMASTPLKHKWRNIPAPYLPFYVRIFAVWQNSGIAMDLVAFNYKFTRHQKINRRISFILQQHNDDINSEDYRNGLKNIEKEEQYGLFAMFRGIIGQILNNTKSFFNKRLLSIPFYREKESEVNKPLIRTRRNKRDSLLNYSYIFSDGSYNVDKTISNGSDVKNIVLKVIDSNVNKTNSNNTTKAEYELDYIKKPTEQVNLTKMNVQFEQRLNNSDKNIDNVSEALQLVFIYDISLLSDGFGPSYAVSEINNYNPVPPTSSSDFELTDHINSNDRSSYILSIDSEGTFIAATCRLHPFLGQIISATYQRIHPKYAIQDALLLQCARFLKNDKYCNNIFLL